MKIRELKRKVKFLYQRIIRGWDDSETWDLGYEFYKWIYPRLERFEKLTVGCPINDKYPTMESWTKELRFRANEAKVIMDCYYDEDKTPDEYIKKYLSKERIKELKKNSPYMLKQHTFWAMEDSFDKWFCETRGQLWW